MGNGIEEARTHDRRYSPAAITASRGKSLPPVLDWFYTVDPAGNVTAIEDLLKAENNRSFGYEDFNYFLTTGNGPWGTRSWTYDAIGNRLSQTRDGAGSTYSYLLNPAAQNTPRLQAISGAETATYLYDAVGNVDVESVPAPVDFTWNRASNLVGISDSSQLVYDGRGYLRSAARPGFAKASFETDLTYSTAGRLLAYESTEEEIQRKYKVVYLAGRPVAVVRIDVASQDVITHYYTTDHLGTPILVTDSAANVHWEGGLEPFGENDANVLKFDVRLGFPGQYADLAWERERPVLRYNVHRWYEPQTGRYTRPDPLGFKPVGVLAEFLGALPAHREHALNLFVYARSNPLAYVDPTGLMECKYTESEPLQSDSPACDKYGATPHMGVSLRCFCKCAGNSTWSQDVRGCLSCDWDKGVNMYSAHAECYVSASKKSAPPMATLVICYEQCFVGFPGQGSGGGW